MTDGKEFTTPSKNNSTELPQDLQPRNTVEKQNDNILCSLGGHSVFSNIHKAPFQVEGTQYSCIEQYIQYSKAQLFDDDLAHHRTMKEVNPYKIKEIGSRIKNYWKEKWQSTTKQIVIKEITAKFFQNKALHDILKATGDMRIAEASRDLFWGTGIHLRDINCLDPSCWYNSGGLMEKVLVAVRAKLFPPK